MTTLRPYQVRAVEESVDLLRRGRRVVVAIPTGGGKTVVGAEVVARLGVRTRWTAHRRELLAQARAKVPPGVGVFSVQERTVVPCDLLVIDEAHHSPCDSYQRHIKPHAGPILGLSATPYRLDGRGLSEVFDELVVPTTTAALIADGYLVKPRTFAARNGPDLRGVKMRAGDYAKDSLAAAVDKPSVVGDAVREYRAKCPTARAVAFCVTVDHATHVAEAFNAAGIPAAALSGEAGSVERDSTLARLASGVLRVVANCQLLTEGWDLPALDAAIILRPTASRSLHLQMLGRVMRAHPGKTSAVVLDHAGNTMRLGFATDPVALTLDGIPKRETGATGLRTCFACYAIFPAGPDVCPECGASLKPEKEEQGSLLVAGIGGVEDLEEIQESATPFAQRAAAWEAFETARVLGGRAPGWSVHQYQARYGEWPIIDAERRLLDPATDEAKRVFYATASRIMAAKGKTAAAAAGMFKGRFGHWPPWSWVKRA